MSAASADMAAADSLAAFLGSPSAAYVLFCTIMACWLLECFRVRLGKGGSFIVILYSFGRASRHPCRMLAILAAFFIPFLPYASFYKVPALLIFDATFAWALLWLYAVLFFPRGTEQVYPGRQGSGACVLHLVLVLLYCRMMSLYLPTLPSQLYTPSLPLYFFFGERTYLFYGVALFYVFTFGLHAIARGRNEPGKRVP